MQAYRGEIKYRLRQNWLLKQMARGYYDCSIAHHSNLTNGRPFKHSTKYLIIKSTLYIFQFQLFRLNKFNSRTLIRVDLFQRQVAMGDDTWRQAMTLYQLTSSVFLSYFSFLLVMSTPANNKHVDTQLLFLFASV